MNQKLDAIERRYEALTADMAQPEVASDYVRFAELDRERAAIERVVQLYREFRRVETEMAQARTMLEESSDRDLRDLAREELDGLSSQYEELEQAIRTELLPKDPRD